MDVLQSMHVSSSWIIMCMEFIKRLGLWMHVHLQCWIYVKTLSACVHVSVLPRPLHDQFLTHTSWLQGDVPDGQPWSLVKIGVFSLNPWNSAKVYESEWFFGTVRTLLVALTLLFFRRRRAACHFIFFFSLLLHCSSNVSVLLANLAFWFFFSGIRKRIAHFCIKHFDFSFTWTLFSVFSLVLWGRSFIQLQ